MKYALTLLICFILGETMSQTDLVHCTDSTYCVPAIIGLPRSKGIEVKQERVFNYGISSVSNDSLFSTNQGDIDRNRRWTFRAKFPVLLRENVKIAAGLSYDIEEFRFRSTQNSDDPFHSAIDEKNLKSLGFALYVLKPFLGNKFLVFRTSANANGDYTNLNQPLSRFMKFSGTVMFGIKVDTHKNLAIGASTNYTFGRRRIYPVIAYNHTFNNRWGIESLLPVYARIRYQPNSDNLLYVKSELAGANYNVSLDINGDGRSEIYYLEKSEIRILGSYEKKLHKWLWVGIDAGLRYNLEFDVSDDFRIGQTEVLLSNTLGEAFMTSLSIFFSPTASMMSAGMKRK